MTLQELFDKLRVLLEENRIPGDSECEMEKVDRKGYEKEVVGVDTSMEYGRIKVKIQVQECY